MALVKCKECGHEVSTKAKACPKCGAEQPKGTSLTTWIVGGVFAVIVFSCVSNLQQSGPTSGTVATRSGPSIDKSPEKQAARKRLIEKLISEGVFQKVDTMGGNLPKAYVRPAFYNLDFETKQQFVSVVYAYYFNGSNISDLVILRDSRGGKDVGDYAPSRGLKMK